MIPTLFCKKCAREASVLLCVALVPAIVTAWVQTDGRKPAWTRAAVEEIAVGKAGIPGPGVIWVDARTGAAFNLKHVPGALSLNEEDWEALLPGFVAAWRPGARVVVYCDDQQCDRSQDVAARLQRELQVGNVYVLKGGWAAWLGAQKP